MDRPCSLSEAPELDGIGNQADRHGTYYAQLALFTCFVVGYIVAWTLPYGLDYTGNIFAALAKVVLMALVAYLPGHGSLRLRLIWGASELLWGSYTTVSVVGSPWPGRAIAERGKLCTCPIV
ncbi:hypothetical protein C8F01DRAFT_323072 [Mycena amicta]|nr:hypothetical protein C8F01DRAFT_323072 [Mycena amicta]